MSGCLTNWCLSCFAMGFASVLTNNPTSFPSLAQMNAGRKDGMRHLVEINEGQSARAQIIQESNVRYSCGRHGNIFAATSLLCCRFYPRPAASTSLLSSPSSHLYASVAAGRLIALAISTSAFEFRSASAVFRLPSGVLHLARRACTQIDAVAV